MKPFLSVIIPCYNEEKNLRRGVLRQTEEYLKDQDYSWEVIIVDDGSTDRSRSLVEKFIKKRPHFRLLKNKHLGKAFAVKAGVEAAKGRVVLFTDMDQSTPLGEIKKLLPYLEDFEIIIGSRGGLRKNAPFYRQLAAVVFRFFRQLVILREINDTQCGFKMFKNEVARDLFGRLQVFEEKKPIKGWRVSAFDVELLFLAEKLGYRIAEVPVEWEDKDIARGKKRNFVRESLEMLKEVFRVKFNQWRGVYD